MLSVIRLRCQNDKTRSYVGCNSNHHKYWHTVINLKVGKTSQQNLHVRNSPPKMFSPSCIIEERAKSVDLVYQADFYEPGLFANSAIFVFVAFSVNCCNYHTISSHDFTILQIVKKKPQKMANSADPYQTAPLGAV